MTLAALSGDDIGGLGPVLADDAALSASSVETGGATMSNTLMQSVLRRSSQAEAEGLDMDRANQLIQSSSGQNLDTHTLERMERAFSHDFDHVRIHADGQASRASELLNAHAFALGADIFFASGVYAPGTPGGDRLLAHELTHVVQNDQGRLPTSGDVSHPSDPHEVEAYQNETRIVEKLKSIDKSMAVEAQTDHETGAEEEGEDLFEAAADEAMVETTPTEVEVAPAFEPVEFAPSAEVDSGADMGSADLDSGGGFELDMGGADPADAGDAADPGVSRRRQQGGGMSLRHQSKAPEQQHEQGKEALPEAVADKVEAVREAGFIGQSAEHVDDEQLVRELSETLSTAPDTGAIEQALYQRGAVHGPDADLASATARVLNTLTRALGLSAGAFEVHLDEHAAERTRALGTRGVMEGGDIYIDAERFDPTSRDGRELLAHEVVHVAQLRQGSASGVIDGAMAEAEAHLIADHFSSGQDFAPVAVGLPASHSAQEGLSLGADIMANAEALRSAMEAKKGEVKASSDGMPEAEGDVNNPDQDREEKMDRYEDGVDGIADEIEDLSAFDDLIEGIEDEDSGDQRRALNRIKGTDDFDKLAGMWAGALAGGPDAGRMKSIFNNEFDDRGFWEETEIAFDKVEAAAKARGEQKYAEKKAEEQKAKEAMEAAQNQGKDGDGEGEDGAAEGAGGEGGGGLAAGAGGPGKGEAGAVPAQPLPTPALETAEARMEPGQLWSQVTTEFEHYNGNVGEVQEAANGGAWDRSGQVFGEMFKGFAAGAFGSFLEQGADSLVLDTLGSAGDYALKAATKGKFKAPLIGPMIGLAQALYDPGAFADGLSQNWEGTTKGFTNGAENFSKAWDKGFSWDAVGLVFCGIADFLGAIASFLSLINDILGILSAVCFVIGGILIAVGLALAWLGIGAALLPIGGWFVNAGNILSRICNVLGPIIMIIKGAAMVFRVLGALLVPAEEYAAQLQAVGEDSKGFGEKVGAKVADESVGHMKNKAAEKFNKTPDADTPAGQSDSDAGAADGADMGKKHRDEVDAANATAEQVNTQLDDINTRRTDDADADGPSSKKKGDGDADADADATTKPKDDGPDADADGPDATKPKDPGVVKQTGAGLKKAFGDFKGKFREIKDIGAEIKRAVKNPGDAANLGISQSVGVDATNEKAKSDIQDRANESKQLRDANAVIEEGINKAAQKKKALEADVKKLKEQYDAMQDNPGGGLEQRLEMMAVHREMTTLKSDVDRLTKTVEDGNAAIQKNNKKADRLDKRNENQQATQDKINDAHDAATTARNRDPDVVQDEMNTLRDEPKNKKKVEDIDADLKAKRDEIEAMETQKKQAAEELAALEKNDDPTLPSDHIDSVKQFQQNQIAEAERTIKQNEKDIAKLEDKREPLQEQLDKAKGLKDEGKTLDELQMQKAQLYGDGNLQSGFDDDSKTAAGRILQTASSGNATGGVGSAYKSFMGSSLLTDTLSAIAGNAPKPVEEKKEDEAAEPTEPTPAQAAEAMLTQKPDEKVEDKAWYQDAHDLYKGMKDSAAGAVYGQFGGPFKAILNAPAPPGESMETMDEHYSKAQQAAYQATESWALAFQAQTGEQLAREMVADEKEFDANQGAEIEGGVQQLGPVGDEMQAKEEQRKSQAAGAKTEAGEPDGEGTGVIGMIISKLAGDGEDYLENMTPDEAADAGNTATDGQSTANEGGKAAKEGAGDASDQNTELISKGKAAQQENQVFIADQRTQLKDKAAKDEEGANELKTMKETYMADATAKTAEAEAEAGSFNSEMDTWAVWAASYRATRESAK